MTTMTVVMMNRTNTTTTIEAIMTVFFLDFSPPLSPPPPPPPVEEGLGCSEVENSDEDDVAIVIVLWGTKPTCEKIIMELDSRP